MQTSFSSELLATSKGKQADSILRACVHCGFCTATCPTYLLTGNELDSPRGRIYLIKEMLETKKASQITQYHLDRCLSCQSCETTCPSNVKYHDLLSIGQDYIESLVPVSFRTKIKRAVLSCFLSNATLFKGLINFARTFSFLLPKRTRKSIALPRTEMVSLNFTSDRKMVLLGGCVQDGLSPNTNLATARVLSKFGIQTIPLEKEGCCGALDFHMNRQEIGLEKAKYNINLMCKQLDQGIEAFISSASGCGNFIKDYAQLLKDDSEYADKANRVILHCFDICEILSNENLSNLKLNISKTMSFQCPCSLQHGQSLNGIVEEILQTLGFNLLPHNDSHLCCGSAGTYSIFQANLSKKLQIKKMDSLEKNNPDLISTANIGCQMHLNKVSKKPIKHWIEFIDAALENEL